MGLPTDATLSLVMQGSVSITGPTGLSTIKESLQIGQGAVWPAMSAAWTFGSGNAQLKDWYAGLRGPIASGANDNLDLAGGLTDDYGNVLTFTKVSLVLVSIDTPDGVKKLRVGPQGVANAWQGKWAAITANFYEEFTDWYPVIYNPWGGGYAVTPGTADILGINNPSASALSYRILIAGVI